MIYVKYQNQNQIYQYDGQIISETKENNINNIILIMTFYTFTYRENTYTDSHIPIFIDKVKLDTEINFLLSQNIEILYITINELVIFNLLSDQITNDIEAIIWHGNQSYIILLAKKIIINSFVYDYKMKKSDIIEIAKYKKISRYIYSNEICDIKIGAILEYQKNVRY